MSSIRSSIRSSNCESDLYERINSSNKFFRENIKYIDEIKNKNNCKIDKISNLKKEIEILEKETLKEYNYSEEELENIYKKIINEIIISFNPNDEKINFNDKKINFNEEKMLNEFRKFKIVDYLFTKSETIKGQYQVSNMGGPGFQGGSNANAEYEYNIIQIYYFDIYGNIYKHYKHSKNIPRWCPLDNNVDWNFELLDFIFYNFKERPGQFNHTDFRYYRDDYRLKQSQKLAKIIKKDKIYDLNILSEIKNYIKNNIKNNSSGTDNIEKFYNLIKNDKINLINNKIKKEELKINHNNFKINEINEKINSENILKNLNIKILKSTIIKKLNNKFENNKEFSPIYDYIYNNIITIEIIKLYNYDNINEVIKFIKNSNKINELKLLLQNIIEIINNNNLNIKKKILKYAKLISIGIKDPSYINLE